VHVLRDTDCRLGTDPVQSFSIFPILTPNIAYEDLLLVIPALEILPSVERKAVGDFLLDRDDLDVLLCHIPL
jgi:hypothetical protein